MPNKARGINKLAHLRSLEMLSEAQLEYALEIIKTENNPETFQAALEVIDEMADPKARPVLLEKYAYCSQEPSRRDSGAYLRSAILKSLRPFVKVEDIALLERAATTYEFLPPGRSEIAMALRSAALITLNEIDEVLAGFHSTRLLTHEYTSDMSGEPAVTAARVLAAQGQLLPLYAYVTGPQTALAEVRAECLRGLVGIPASLLPDLVARFRDSQEEIVLLGLFDLLLAHSAGASYNDFFREFLFTTRLLNLYRYLVIGIVARKQNELLDQLAASAKAAKDVSKTRILEELRQIR